MASKKLTSDEVNALMEGLQSSSQTGAAVDVATSNEVRPFAFGEDDLSLMGDYYALRLINERFARFARTVFQPMLRVQPRISSFPPEVKTFDEYSSSLDSFMSLSTYRIEELRVLEEFENCSIRRSKELENWRFTVIRGIRKFP